MNNPLISFITPVYNTEEYLPECIESVLKQTSPEWELVLVDDGSTDKSGSICDYYAGKDNRIKVIHKENGGQFNTRLTGISAASGAYCTGLDSDDYIENNCVEKLGMVLGEKGYDIVAWNIKEFSGGTVRSQHKMDRYGEYDRDEFLEYVASSTNHSFCNKLIRTELLRRSDYGTVLPHIRYSEDYILICPSLCMAESIVAIDDYLYNYRQTDESVTHMYSSKRVLDCLESTACIMKIFDRYTALTDRLIEAEYRSLAGSVGYCLKQAYKNKHTNDRELEMIRSNPIYKELGKYENGSNLSGDNLLFMKLFRFSFDGMIKLIYGRK